MYDLSDRLVFITGASSGIGAACAEAFARAGARLLLCARRTDRLTAVADRLRRAHDADVYTLTLDVRDDDAVQEAYAGLPPGWQAIDVLVNNAGLSRGLEPAYANTPDQIDTMVDTNVKGLLYVTRAVTAPRRPEAARAPCRRRNGRRGRALRTGATNPSPGARYVLQIPPTLRYPSHRLERAPPRGRPTPQCPLRLAA